MLRELLTGIAGGTLSGIAPGIHVNTLGAFLSGMGVRSNLLLFAMGLTHTFLDVIPSAFLGVPDEGTALGVLPAHRLVLRGRAMEVVRIALWASFLAVLLSIPLMPFYMPLARRYRPELGRLFVLLLAALVVGTERGRGKAFALLVFLLSGLLGILTFRLGLSQPFYHLFTGLFGLSVVLLALRSGAARIGGGEDGRILLGRRRFAGLSLLGTLLGMVASLVPAFTASQAALIGSLLSKDERSFLTVVFSVNTANFMFSFANFLSTGRRRNGIVALMAPVPGNDISFYLLAAVFVSMAVLLYAEPLAALILRLLGRVPYRALNSAVAGVLVALSYLFDGVTGLVVLLGGAMIGLLAAVLGVKRTNCMGVLMLPIIIG
ncbi:membrane protein, conserved [Thermococcus sp. 4557]|uniref:tripartite tricarboxylate transporter permease n=1 Tax=Thermococcus sp. (strain CGMCC 1.5172 / 4557) TaxID=1042877 RepID=UPI000219E7DC|nr:tripartite tricarboxylate transporter permease [Thermococcus sp. 4557]AEK73167.1 membrane protein, conserved [Thermococcus sp. 4557]